MDIVITQWALNSYSYLDLTNNNIVSRADYTNIIRPDVMLLKSNPADPRFSNAKFWSAASDKSMNRISNGFKMKWHNLGNGKIQLRLLVGVFADAMLCEAYAKGNSKEDHRKMARFKVHLELIRRGQYTECGRL